MVGIELNASYLRSATSGRVTAVCTPVRRGRTLATYLIEVTDDQGRPTASARLTCLVKERLSPAQRRCRRPRRRSTRRPARRRAAPSAGRAPAGARPGGRRSTAARRGRQPVGLPGDERPHQQLTRHDPAGGERREAHAGRGTAAARPRARRRWPRGGRRRSPGRRAPPRRAGPRPTPRRRCSRGDDEVVDGDLRECRARRDSGSRPSTASPTACSPALAGGRVGPGSTARTTRCAGSASSARNPSAAAAPGVCPVSTPSACASARCWRTSASTAGRSRGRATRLRTRDRTTAGISTSTGR